MRRIKTWLTSSTLQKRFNNLAVISIENDIFKTIDREVILDSFEKRLIVLFKLNILIKQLGN